MVFGIFPRLRTILVRPPRVILAGALASLQSASAGVTVNNPLPITHEVIIQPIITAHSQHGEAVFMGSANSESYIKEQIDLVWAQSGIDVTWLPEVVYADNFAYDGSTVDDYSNDRRPQSDLTKIRNQAGTPPKSTDPTVINMFFVEIVPGFEQLPDNYANGLATIDANGICMHVGANLVNWQGGRDVIASVIAHEIGHNLGLYHFSGSSNLMSSGDPDSYLISSQTNTVFTDRSGIDGFDFLRQAVTPTNYSLWVAANSVSGGPDEDDDGDRIRNIVEFMLDLDPRHPDSLPEPMWGASGLTWTLPKHSEALEDGLEMTVEVSSDLDDWDPAGSDGSSVVLQDNASQLSVRLAPGLQGGFMRLNVEIPENVLGGSASFTPEEVVAAGSQDIISCCSHGGCGCRSAQHP